MCIEASGQSFTNITKTMMNDFACKLLSELETIENNIKEVKVALNNIKNNGFMTTEMFSDTVAKAFAIIKGRDFTEEETNSVFF